MNKNLQQLVSIFILVAIALLVISTAGCSTIGHQRVVTQDRPVVVVPTLPKIPQYQLEVDKLSPSDKKNPGKVGKAYKHDLILLRRLVKIYQDTFDQLQKASTDFSDVDRQIMSLSVDTRAFKTAPLKEPSK